MKKVLYSVLIIMTLLTAGIFMSGLYEVKPDPEDLQREIVLMQEAKKEFEAEMTNALPVEGTKELAPYGADFYQTHTEGYVSGYILTKVYRLRNYTKADAATLFDSYLEQKGYHEDPNGFTISTEVIPFENEGFVDVKVELTRRDPFDINRRYYDELRNISF